MPKRVADRVMAKLPEALAEQLAAHGAAPDDLRQAAERLERIFPEVANRLHIEAELKNVLRDEGGEA